MRYEESKKRLLQIREMITKNRTRFDWWIHRGWVPIDFIIEQCDHGNAYDNWERMSLFPKWSEQRWSEMFAEEMQEIRVTMVYDDIIEDKRNCINISFPFDSIQNCATGSTIDYWPMDI